MTPARVSEAAGPLAPVILSANIQGHLGGNRALPQKNHLPSNYDFTSLEILGIWVG